MEKFQALFATKQELNKCQLLLPSISEINSSLTFSLLKLSTARITEGTTKGKQVLEAPCYVPICLSISIIATVIRTNKCECMCGESEMLINCNLRKQNKQTYPFSICWYIFTLLLFLTIFVLIMKKLKKKNERTAFTPLPNEVQDEIGSELLVNCKSGYN